MAATVREFIFDSVTHDVAMDKILGCGCLNTSAEAVPTQIFKVFEFNFGDSPIVPLSSYVRFHNIVTVFSFLTSVV
jgi:hypothetical protein